MDHKDCLILKTVREVRTLTKTSQLLFISQPALTYRLQNLERELGVPLVIRTNAGILFTPQGKLLCDFAEDVLERWTAVTQEIQQMSSEVRGEIRLAVSSTIAQRRLAPLLKGFMTAHPLVTFDLQIGSSTQLIPDLLDAHKVDCALLRGDWQGDLPYIMLDEEPLGIVTAGPFRLAELPHENWIRYTPSTVTESEKVYENWWKEQFKDPHPHVVRTDTVESAIQMVTYGLGWCIAPKLHVRPHTQLTFTPISGTGGTALTRRTHIVYHAPFRDTPLGKSFIDYVCQHYHKVK